MNLWTVYKILQDMLQNLYRSIHPRAEYHNNSSGLPNCRTDHVKNLSCLIIRPHSPDHIQSLVQWIIELRS